MFEKDTTIIERLMGLPPIKGKSARVSAYDWLGLERFEDDPEIIEAAASSLMKRLQTVVSSYNDIPEGREKQIARRLLSETARRRRLLLDPDAKEDYDERLMALLELVNTPKQTFEEPPVIPWVVKAMAKTKLPATIAKKKEWKLRRRRRDRVRILFILAGGIMGVILAYCLLAF